MPLEDIIEPVVSTSFARASLEPATNVIYSLSLLDRSSHLSGLGSWIEETLQRMSREERERNSIVLNGLYLAVMPQQSWHSFPAYVDHLASIPSQLLQEKLLDAYLQMSCRIDQQEGEAERPSQFTRKDQILASFDHYLAFLYERFDESHLDETVEAQAYSYLIDPPRMQNLIVSHLREMWNRYLANEWRRVEPMLNEVVRAFYQSDFRGMGWLEIARAVTGQSLDSEKWESLKGSSARLVFIPNPHIGPYLGKTYLGDSFGIIYGARLPDGAEMDIPDLSRNEILVRLAALADDSRLRILKQVAEKGELRSQDIMQTLDLSQSATSRHLTQLSATGYLVERRCDGAKCYSLDSDRIEDTLQALRNFLLKS